MNTSENHTRVLREQAHTLLHTQFPQPWEAIEAQVLRAGHWEGELVHTRRDGTPLVVTSHWAVCQPDDGAPLAIVEISTDITERKQVERSQRLLAAAGRFPGRYQPVGQHRPRGGAALGRLVHGAH